MIEGPVGFTKAGVRSQLDSSPLSPRQRAQSGGRNRKSFCDLWPQASIVRLVKGGPGVQRNEEAAVSQGVGYGRVGVGCGVRGWRAGG
jgi:hypothetical protein